MVKEAFVSSSATKAVNAFLELGQVGSPLTSLAHLDTASRGAVTCRSAAKRWPQSPRVPLCWIRSTRSRHAKGTWRCTRSYVIVAISLLLFLAPSRLRPAAGCAQRPPKAVPVARHHPVAP